MNFARIRAELKSLSGGDANVLFRYRRKFLLTARFARKHPGAGLNDISDDGFLAELLARLQTMQPFH